MTAQPDPLKLLFLIPARGGSKGIPGKNIRLLGGKPLIAWAIDLARKFASDADICLSTDSRSIADVAEQYGLPVPFLRPEPMAGDQSPTREAILHALDHYRSQGRHYDAVVLLQPTSPFRKPEDVSRALALYKKELDMVVTVVETRANPYYVLFEENADGFLVKSKSGDFSSRQACPKVWEFNGAVYVINAEAVQKMNISNFTRICKSEMDPIASVDLDTETDWAWAEFLIGRGLAG